MDSIVKEYLFHEGYLQTLKSMITNEHKEEKEKKDKKDIDLNDKENKSDNSKENKNLILDIDNNMKID